MADTFSCAADWQIARSKQKLLGTHVVLSANIHTYEGGPMSLVVDGLAYRSKEGGLKCKGYNCIRTKFNVSPPHELTGQQASHAANSDYWQDGTQGCSVTKSPGPRLH